MKKILFLTLLSLAFVSFVPSSYAATLTPNHVYVGDSITISCDNPADYFWISNGSGPLGDGQLIAGAGGYISCSAGWLSGATWTSDYWGTNVTTGQWGYGTWAIGEDSVQGTSTTYTEAMASGTLVNRNYFVFESGTPPTPTPTPSGATFGMISSTNASGNALVSGAYSVIALEMVKVLEVGGAILLTIICVYFLIRRARRFVR